MITDPDPLRELLIKHEGLRLKPYTDSVGKLTIGVGRNLTDVGISELEAMGLLNADIERVRKDAGAYPWFSSIGAVRQDVVLSMAFNMGWPRLLGFQNMIMALIAQDYGKAADEMVNSHWAGQVGPRAVELARMMRFGVRG